LPFDGETLHVGGVSDADDASKSNKVIGLGEASELPTKTAALAHPCTDGG
jgi:hypothetical protein